MKTVQACNIFFFVSCISGFAFQLHQVSNVYFKYQTTSKTLIQVKEVDDYPDVIYCPAYYYMLNRANADKYGIMKDTPTTLKDIVTDLSKLKIKEILELTPDTTSIIETCEIRDQNKSIVNQLNSTDCYKFFTINKSVNGERICYRFTPSVTKKYSVGNVASSLTHMTNLYSIRFYPHFGAACFGFIMSYFLKEKDPLYSRMFAAKFKNGKTMNQSGLSVHGETTEIRRLPDPHDTQCFPGHDRQVCYEACLIEKFKAIERVPWSGFHSDPLELRMFTPLDYDNQTMASIAQESLDQCHNKCKIKTECFTKFSVTSAHEHRTTYFVINSMIPSRPSTSILTIPYLTLIEYIIQVGSCFGVWFGLSILSFNPTKWFLGNQKQTIIVNKISKTQNRFFVSRTRRFW